MNSVCWTWLVFSPYCHFAVLRVLTASPHFLGGQALWACVGISFTTLYSSPVGLATMYWCWVLLDSKVLYESVLWGKCIMCPNSVSAGLSCTSSKPVQWNGVLASRLVRRANASISFGKYHSWLAHCLAVTCCSVTHWLGEFVNYVILRIRRVAKVVCLAVEHCVSELLRSVIVQVV